MNAIKTLERLLEDPNDLVRLAAVLSLANLEDKAKSAVPAIAKLLKGQNSALVRAAALVALQAIGPPRNTDFSEIAKLLAEQFGDAKAGGIPNTEDLVQLYVFVSALPWSTAKAEGAKDFMAKVADVRRWARRSLETLPHASWQIPALARGINVCARFQLGFTEPFAGLTIKLRSLAEQSKNAKELLYVVGRLGHEVPKNSSYWGPVQQTRLQVLSSPFLLEKMIADQQRVFAKSLLALGSEELRFLVYMARGICHENPLYRDRSAKATAHRDQLALQFLLALKTERLFRDLWKLGTPALLEKLKDADPLVRWTAVSAVASKRIRVEEQLITLLADPVPEVADAAHRALIRLARGTDFGPQAPNSAAKTQLAMQRWREWLAMQEPVSAAGSQRPSTRPPTPDPFDPPKRIIKKSRE